MFFISENAKPNLLEKNSFSFAEETSEIKSVSYLK